MKRREFLRNASLAIAGAGTASAARSDESDGSDGSDGSERSAQRSAHPSTERSARIRFGVISDLHHDNTFDAPQRLQAFIDAMNRENPDFILELGDFCCPLEKNKVIADIWNGFPGEKHHVIGNHEMDLKCTKEQVVSFWAMPGRYYSFDRKGFHFVIMDGNAPDPGKPKQKHPSGIEEEQMQWLSADLAGTHLPTIVFCHQGFDNVSLRNREAVRTLLENTGSRKGNGRVVAVFSGHYHKDYYNLINGIHYVEINSSTYRFLGRSVNNDSFGPEAEKAHPLIRYMAYYQDPLWALVEVTEDGMMEVHGRKTVWMGKSPRDLGAVEHEWDYPSVSAISHRRLRLL